MLFINTLRFLLSFVFHTFAVQKNAKTLEFIRDIWQYFKERKKIWLAPVIVLLLIIGTIIVLGSSSAFAPFIYTLF